jgi:soluble lytic murein transglycosylase-like protein
MPATWRDVARQLDMDGSPHDEIAIDAGAYYMARLRHTWRRGRSSLERHELAQASYNAGAGNILKAQKYCGNARLWPVVRECLHRVTGPRNATETVTYVERIQRWWRQMELAR